MEEIPLDVFEQVKEQLRAGDSILGNIIISTEKNKISTLQDCIDGLAKDGKTNANALREELLQVVAQVVIT